MVGTWTVQEQALSSVPHPGPPRNRMRHQSPDGIEEMGIGDGASGEKQSRPPHCPTSILLRVLVLVLNLLVDDTEGGEEIAQEEDEEGEATHEDL